MHNNEPRLTSSEAAKLLGVTRPEAVQLLRAAGIPFSRCAGRGLYLWNQAAVQEFVTILKRPAPPAVDPAAASEGEAKL